MLPAAGQGLRLGAGQPKALASLGGRALLIHTLSRFAPLGLVHTAVILAPAGHTETYEALLGEFFPGHACTVLEGGAERQASVERGIAALDRGTEIVIIHDAARPFPPEQAVREAMEAANGEYDGATVALPCADTILVGDTEQLLRHTPERRYMWACQTPQVFPVAVIRAAHERARTEGFQATDDASLVQRMGGRVKLVHGSPLNFKVTSAADLALAEAVYGNALA